MRTHKKAPPREDLIDKLVSDEARRLNAELSHRVEESTQQLLNAQAELEAFSYSISHDLRAPLIHIGGFVDLVLNHCGEQLDSKGRHYLKTIAVSAYKMGRMIDDMLALSRLSHAELHPVAIDLADVVQEVVMELKPLTEYREIHWVIERLPSVHADPTLLRQVLLNLFSNAVKFTEPRDQAYIQVGARLGTNEVIVFVKDNGVGFNPKHRDKLFGVFQRLHAAAEFEGTGVGLAFVRRIIQRHGGRTWADGVPGEGATFYFSLPEKNAGLS